MFIHSAICGIHNAITSSAVFGLHNVFSRSADSNSECLHRSADWNSQRFNPIGRLEFTLSSFAQQSKEFSFLLIQLFMEFTVCSLVQHTGVHVVFIRSAVNGIYTVFTRSADWISHIVFINSSVYGMQSFSTLAQQSKEFTMSSLQHSDLLSLNCFQNVCF